MAKTINKAENILNKAPNEYTNPEGLSAGISQAMRNKKAMEAEKVAELTKIVRHELPGATESRITATVLRRMYENDQTSHLLADPELTGKPDLSLT